MSSVSFTAAAYAVQSVTKDRYGKNADPRVTCSQIPSGQGEGATAAVSAVAAASWHNFPCGCHMHKRCMLGILTEKGRARLAYSLTLILKAASLAPARRPAHDRLLHRAQRATQRAVRFTGRTFRTRCMLSLLTSSSASTCHPGHPTCSLPAAAAGTTWRASLQWAATRMDRASDARPACAMALLILDLPRHTPILKVVAAGSSLSGVCTARQRSPDAKSSACLAAFSRSRTSAMKAAGPRKGCEGPRRAGCDGSGSMVGGRMHAAHVHTVHTTPDSRPTNTAV